MAQAQNYSTTNFENKSKDSISSIDPYSFDNNLINMVDFISEDSDNLMNDYLTHDEIIKTKIILVDNDKNTFENTITDNNFLLSLRENNFTDAADAADDNDDAYNRAQQQKELLKYINFVDYSKIERQKIQTEYNKYTALKSNLVVLQLRKQKYEKIREENSMYNYFFGITSSKILWTAVGTGAVISLNIAVCASLSNPATWISMASQIYNNSLQFGFFIDFMTMLDIFNINEKLSLKQLFYQLKNQIDASKILKNPDGSLKDPSTLLPYDNKEFMEFFFTSKINPNVIIDNPTLYSDQLAKFSDFIVKNPDGNINVKKQLEFINSVELNNFTSFISSIIDKKNIYKPITYSTLQNKWLALIMDTINSPYIYTIISSLKIGGNIFGYIDTTIDAIQNVPNIDSTFVYRGATTAIRNSDAFKNVTYLLTKGSLDTGIKSFNAIFGNELLKNGDEYMSNLPFIGGIVNGKNLEQIFITSVSSIINAQITGSIDGYFKPMVQEVKLASPDSGDDNNNNNNKNNIIDNIEFELKERVKYKKLGYTNDEIAELLESNPEKENEYQNFIFKGIRYFYKTFKRYSQNPKLIAYALCNCTGLFNLILQLISSGLLYTCIQDFIITGWFHYNFFDVGIDFLKLNVMKIVTIIIESTLGGNYKFQGILLNLKYEFIQTFLHDLTLFISDIQTLIYNKITDNALNKKYMDSIFSNFYFKIFKNCITLTYNILLIPSLNIQLNSTLVHGITEINIFDILKNEEKCKKFFLFLNHKFYNMLIGIGKLDVYNLVQYFQDFFYMDKILYNTVIPYFNLTTGYYDWDNYNLDSLSGAIIKIKSRVSPQTTGGVSRITPGEYIILNSDLNKKEFQLLSFDEIITQFITDFGVTKNSITGSIITSPTYEYKDSNNNDLSGNLFECITRKFVCSDKDNFNTAFFWYYYDMFRKDSTIDKDPLKKDMSEFKKWLLEKKMPEVKNNPPDENKVEYAILNSLVLELSEKSTGSSDIFTIPPPLDFNIDPSTTTQLDTFLNSFKTLGKSTTSNKVETVTQENLISNMEDEITLPIKYSSVYGYFFTPLKFKTIDFFTIGNILNAITNSNKTKGLTNKIEALNEAAENNQKLKYVLNILESSKKRELLEINKEVTKFSENFQTSFNSDNSVPLQYIGFNFEDFIKNCQPIIDLSFLQSITTDKDNYIIAVKKFIIEMSSIKNICTDANGKIIFLYNDNNENIDANTGIKTSCTNIEVLDETKLNDKLLYDLLCRPTTLANIISNSEFYFSTLSAKDKLFVSDFISKLDINSEKLLDLVDFTLNDNTLLQDKLNFNSVTYFINEIITDQDNRQFLKKYKSPYNKAIIEYIKQISGIKYKCNDKNNNPIYFDINKNNLDTGGQTIALCIGPLEEIDDINDEITKNINNIIFRPFFLEKSQEEIQIENLSPEEIDIIGYFRLDLKKIHKNIRKYQKNMYEKIEIDVEKEITESLQGSSELDKLFQIQKYLSFIKFKNLFSLVNEKGKLDSNIQKELLTYLTTDIKYIQNIRLLDSQYQQKIDELDSLCVLPIGYPPGSSPDPVPLRALFDKEFLIDIVYKNINNQDESLYLDIGSDYYEGNQKIFASYKKLFEVNKGDLLKIKNQSDFLKDISSKTGTEICNDPVYKEYVESIKKWYKVQENMRISFVLYNANKKYTYFESNIKSNDENIWNFYISYNNDIDALYNEYIVNPQRIANAINSVITSNTPSSTPSSSAPSSSNPPTSTPPSSAQQLPSLQEKTNEQQIIPNNQFSQANVESAARAEAEKQQQAQDLTNQEGLDLSQDIGLESTESIDLQSVETTGLKLMNMLANMFGGMGDFFSSLMSGKMPPSRAEIVKGINQFKEEIKEDNPSKVLDECKRYNNWQWDTPISTKKTTIKFNDNTYDERRKSYIRSNCNKESYIIFAFKKLVEFSSRIIGMLAMGGIAIGNLLISKSNNSYLKILGGTILGLSSAISYAPHCFILVFYYCMVKVIDSFIKSGNLNAGQKLLISFVAQAYNGYEAYLIENNLTSDICNSVFQILNIGDDAASNIKLMIRQSLDKCLKKKYDGTEFYNGMFKGQQKYEYNFYGNYDISNTEEIQQEIISLPVILSNFLTEKEKTVYKKYKTEFEIKCPNGVVSDCSFYNEPYLKDTNILKIVISTGDLLQVFNYISCQVFDIPFSQFNILTLMMDLGKVMVLIPFYITKGVVDISKKIMSCSSDWLKCLTIINDIIDIITNVCGQLWIAIKNTSQLGNMLFNLFNRRYETIKLLSNFFKIICKEKSIRNIFLFYVFGEKTTIIGNKIRINPIRDVIDDALDGLDKEYIKEENDYYEKQKNDVENFERTTFTQTQIDTFCNNMSEQKKWKFNKNSNNQIDIFTDVDGDLGFNIIFEPDVNKIDKLEIINDCIEKYIKDMDKMATNPYDVLKISVTTQLLYITTPQTMWKGWIDTAYTDELTKLGTNPDPNDVKTLDNAKAVLSDTFLKNMYDNLNIKPFTEAENQVIRSYKVKYYRKIKVENDYNDTPFLNTQLTDVFTKFLNDTEKKLLSILSFGSWLNNNNGTPDKKNLEIFSNFEKCNKKKDCNSVFLMDRLFKELEKKVVFINYDTSKPNNPIEPIGKRPFYDLFTRAKDEFIEYLRKTNIKDKSDYYENTLKKTLNQLNDALTEYQTKEGNENNLFCDLDNPNAVTHPDIGIRNGFDLVNSEKTYGTLFPQAYTCDQVNDQINIYVTQSKDILNYFLKSYEIKGKIEEMAKNRGKNNEVSFISFAISNIFSFFKSNKKKQSIPKTQSYLLKPCNEDQFLFIDNFEPKCITFIEPHSEIISDSKITEIKDEEKSYFNLNYLELENRIKINLKEYIKDNLFKDSTNREENLYEFIKDDLDINKKIDEFIKKYSSQILNKIKSGENPNKFLSELNKEFYEKLNGDFFIIYHIEEKINEKIISIEQSITSTDENIISIEQSITSTDGQQKDDLQQQKGVLQQQKVDLQQEKNKLDSNLIFLTKLKQNMDELSKLPINKDTICRSDHYFCQLMKNEIDKANGFFDLFINKKIDENMKTKKGDLDEMVLLYLYYNGMIKDSNSSYSDEELSKIYEFYLKISESLQKPSNPEISEILLQDPNNPTKKIFGEFENLLRNNPNFRTKIRNSLYSILFKTHEINNYYKISYIVPQKQNTKVQINTPNQQGGYNIDIFENEVTTNPDKRIEFFSVLMGKDYKNDPSYWSDFLTLNNYGLFFQLGTNGVVVETYNKPINRDKTYMSTLYDLAIGYVQYYRGPIEYAYNARYFLMGKYFLGSYGYDIKWESLSKVTQEYTAENIQLKILESINNLGLYDSNNKIIRVPFFPENKVNDLPPTILYNYKERDPTVPSLDQDIFVKKYYTDISYVDTQGVTHVYKIFTPELEYYKYTFDDFDETKFVEELHKNRLKPTTQIKLTNTDFLNFLKDNAEKIVIDPATQQKDIIGHLKDFGLATTGAPPPESSMLFGDVDYRTRVNYLKTCIQKTIDPNSRKGFLWDYPDVDSLKFKDLVSTVYDSNCAILQDNKVMKLDLDTLYTYYKLSLIQKPNFEYLENLKIKGVPDIKQKIGEKMYSFSSFREIFNLPIGELYNSLKKNFPFSIFSLMNQLDFTITLNKSGDKVEDVNLIYGLENLVENTN